MACPRTDENVRRDGDLLLFFSALHAQRVQFCAQGREGFVLRMQRFEIGGRLPCRRQHLKHQFLVEALAGKVVIARQFVRVETAKLRIAGIA